MLGLGSWLGAECAAHFLTYRKTQNLDSETETGFILITPQATGANRWVSDPTCTARKATVITRSVQYTSCSICIHVIFYVGSRSLAGLEFFSSAPPPRKRGGNKSEMNRFSACETKEPCQHSSIYSNSRDLSFVCTGVILNTSDLINVTQGD